MSWSDRRPILVAALLLAVSACTVQPLYGTGPAGVAVGTGLAAIAVDPVTTEVAQELRNRLLFDLTGGGAQNVATRYKLDLTVDSSELALGVTPVETSPAYSVTVTATYVVTSVATGQIVLRATARQSASYDRVNQAFANERAKQDAESRAAALAADDIHLSLAAAAAAGRI
jgi:LPS-assembly lipoprotein